MHFEIIINKYAIKKPQHYIVAKKITKRFIVIEKDLIVLEKPLIFTKKGLIVS